MIGLASATAIAADAIAGGGTGGAALMLEAAGAVNGWRLNSQDFDTQKSRFK